MTDLFPLTSSERLSLQRYGGAVNADIGYSGLQWIDRSPEKNMIAFLRLHCGLHKQTF